MTRITLNGSTHQIEPGYTLELFLQSLGLDPHTFASAVNGTFVARTQRHECVLCEGDEVVTFQAIVGG